MPACATCGAPLDGGLLDAVLVSDLGADGVPVALFFGRACGHARALLRPTQLEHYQASTGTLPPARTGKDATRLAQPTPAHEPEPAAEPERSPRSTRAAPARRRRRT